MGSMDETWVHPFTSGLDVVLPTANPWTRPYLPFNSNGGNNAYAQREPVAAPVAAQIASKDIANHEVRPDVYVTVHKLLNPVAMGRFREPRPSEAPTEQTWDDGPKPKEAPKPEFKFKAPKEVDEEAVMAKRLSDAAANVEKGKKAKNKADDASFKHDPEEKAKPVDGEEKKEKKEKEEEKEEKEEEAGEKKDTPKEKKEKEEEKEERKRKQERRRTLQRRRRLRLLKRVRRRRIKKKRKKPRKLMLTRRRRKKKNPSNRSRRLSLRSKRMVTRRKRRKSQLLPQRKSMFSSQQFTKIKLTLTPQIRGLPSTIRRRMTRKPKCERK